MLKFFNICSGVGYTVQEIINKFSEILNFDINPYILNLHYIGRNLKNCTSLNLYQKID